MKSSIWPTLVLAMALCGCKEIEEPTPSHDSFFPLSINTSWTYHVDSTHYSGFSGDSAVYEFERNETITDRFGIDSVSNPSFILRISTRKNETKPWVENRLSTVAKDVYRAIRKDDNVTIVKLVFPVKDKKTWDANQMNVLDPNLVRYRNVYHEYKLDTVTFKRTLKVDQRNEINSIEENICWEIYADNIGLVEKYFTKTQTQQGKKSGVHYHWKLMSFSK